MKDWKDTAIIVLASLIIIIGTFAYNLGLQRGIESTHQAQENTISALNMSANYHELLIKCYDK